MESKPHHRVVEKEMFPHLADRRARTSPFGSMGAIVAIVSLAALCCAVPVSRGAGPTNDLCASAEVIPGTAGASGAYYTSVKDISLTTTNGDPESCHEFVARSIWYTFTPNASAIYTVSACNDPAAPTATTVSDTVMAIYTSAGGCAGPFARIDCSDDSCGPGGLQSSITRQLFADTTYHIVIWQYFDPLDPPPSAGVVQLRVTRSIRPPNDTCATAMPVPLNFPVTGSTIGADNNYQLAADSSCFSGVGQVASTAPGRDVVFAFTAPRAGEYNFKVYNYSQNNLVLYVAGSCPSTGTPATVTNCLGAANRSPASSAEEVICVSLAASQRVFIFVDEHGFTTGSSFMFEVNPCFREREPNNAWTNANYAACGTVGTIQSDTDVDWYFVGSPPAGSRAFVLIDGEAAGTTDFDLRLTTSTDTLDYDDQDNDSAFGTLSPNIAGTILPGRPVYARVDFRGVPTEPYHIYTVVQPPLSAATPESEPNDTRAEANFAEANYYQGALATNAPSTDVDMFTFTAEGSESVFVSLDGDPLRNNTPINAKLELLDEFGNILITVDDNNALSSTNSGAGRVTANTPRSPSEAFVYRVANDGTYFVRVTISPNTVGPTGAGDYLLSISKSCYIASATFRSWVRMGNGTVTLRLEGTPGASYHIEHSNNLRTWTPLPSVIADSNGVVQFQDTTAVGAAQRFYRAVSP